MAEASSRTCWGAAPAAGARGLRLAVVVRDGNPYVLLAPGGAAAGEWPSRRFKLIASLHAWRLVLARAPGKPVQGERPGLAGLAER